jgi:UDP-glucose 4-epimerase
MADHRPPDLSRPRALVTGGAGFIGSALVRRLLDSGLEVEVYDRLNPGRADFLPDHPGLTLTVGDLLDAADFRATVARVRPAVVFHLAALHYIPYCNGHPGETLRTNVEGTEAVVRACAEAEVPRFVFASTAAVYPAQATPLSETGTPPGPLDIYGFSKHFGEQLIAWTQAQTTRTGFVVARLFNAYGPRETSPHLIPAVLKQIVEGAPRIRIGNLEPRRDYVHVDDIAQALIRLGEIALEAGPEPLVVNVCTGADHSVREVLDALGQAAGRPLAMEPDPARMRTSDRPRLLGDPARLRNLLGEITPTTLPDGLAALIAWARAHPELMVG